MLGIVLAGKNDIFIVFSCFFLVQNRCFYPKRELQKSAGRMKWDASDRRRSGRDVRKIKIISVQSGPMEECRFCWRRKEKSFGDKTAFPKLLGFVKAFWQKAVREIMIQ